MDPQAQTPTRRTPRGRAWRSGARGVLVARVALLRHDGGPRRRRRPRGVPGRRPRRLQPRLGGGVAPPAAHVAAVAGAPGDGRGRGGPGVGAGGGAHIARLCHGEPRRRLEDALHWRNACDGHGSHFLRKCVRQQR